MSGSKRSNSIPQELNIPESFPNFSRLYHEVLTQLSENGLEPFGDNEAFNMGLILGLELEDLSNPLIYRILEEVDFFQVPKWVALLGWISPYGLAAQEPKLFLRIAKYLLGDTKAVEEKYLLEIQKKAKQR